ncbi:hypothetical protein EUGRSUZ_K02504 [Eucalyptus grandis]|uniref:Uncharacterized protein n=2 Tax=Eucalyptus grandis TaxID=71139 RepID=A0ACC3IWM0_EUCGR|nr:hypothetical protein EUGRSUZ_K02504 [Eucalyptus grandis]
MGSESNLKTWVSDKLMSLLGYSQSTIVQYFIELAKQSSSPTQVVDKLVEFGLSSSSETRAFAEEVFARVPHKTAGLSLYQKQEREAALLARKQKTYAMLDADDDDDDGDSKPNVSQGGIDNGSSSITISETGKGASHKKRFRKKSGSHEDEDEESIAHVDEERMVKRRASYDEDGGSESEEERSRDQKEREELERHLKARDAAGTRKVQLYL